MRAKGRWFVAMGLAAGILMGLAMAATAQFSGATIQQQYEQQLKKIDKNKADDLYNLAKWCYQNGLATEATSLALEANQKAPDDVRPKYLLYVLAGGTGTTVETTETTTETTPTAISDEEVKQIYDQEGKNALMAFSQAQNVLISRCGSPRCHGGGNPQAKWSLLRSSLTSQKTLAQNFRTVNVYINRENLPSSRLLVMPLKGKEAGHSVTVFRSAGDPGHIIINNWCKMLKTKADLLWSNAAAPPPAPAPAAPSGTP